MLKTIILKCIKFSEESSGKKEKSNFKTFRKMGEKYQVCPFELQMEAAQDADVVDL
jgi:DNA excision repair protein ERCC-2